MNLRRALLSMLAAMSVLVLGLAGPSSAIPGHGDGSPEDGPPVEDQHGSPGGHLAASSANVQLIGKLDDLTGVTSGISDVGAYGNYAYLGAFSPECAGRPGAQGTGVHVVDISDPANPSKVAFIPAHSNSFVGEGVHVIHMETQHFTGEVLVHNNETCNSSLLAPSGFSLWNVTDPTNPQPLTLNFGDPSPAVANQTYHTTHSTFAWWVPETGKAYVIATDNNEVADVDIFDITDPTSPVLVSERGFADWPGAHAPLANGDSVFHHDMQVKKIGTQWKALISYWDAGWVILDVTDPANPLFIDDSNYPTPDPLTGFSIPEGNAHQAWWSSNNKFILGTDEDFSPTRTNCTIADGPHAGPTPCGEFGWTVPLSTNYPGGLSGSTVFGGSGCVEDLNANGVSDRDEVPSQASTGAETVVFSRGTCFFSIKVESGQMAGYKSVAIGNSHVGSRDGLVPDAFICGGQGHAFTITASAVCIGHRAMHQLFGDPPAYTGADLSDLPEIGTMGAGLTAQGGVYDGWGYVHLLDANTLQEIDAYAVPEGLDPAFASGFGNLTVHEVQTDPRLSVNLAYFSYYDAGLRVAKFGKNGIHEVGHYIAEGGNDFWGIEPIQHQAVGGNKGQPLLLLSDRDSGLWLFTYTGE